MKRIFVIAPLILCMFTVFALGITRYQQRGQSVDLAESARQQIHESMSRESAVKLLQATAWRQSTCFEGNTIKDLFLYGYQSDDIAGVVYIESQVNSGTYYVIFVGQEENDNLKWYDHCENKTFANRPLR
jgi:hypothetical protein